MNYFVASYGVDDSRAAFSLSAFRKGQGWTYRRRWRDGRTGPWLKTSEAGLRFLLDRYRAALKEPA